MFLCIIAIMALSPIIILTAVCIKCSSNGPIFYISHRAGKGKKPFRFYKFRSMHMSVSDKGLFIADQERLFPFGKMIRRMKIDELPQLLNVIKGDMSIVGPRPMPMASVETTYCGKYEIVLTVKPGLTSPASLYDYMIGDTYTDDNAYRSDILPHKLELELHYIQRQCLKYDAYLVLKTIVAIIAVLCGRKFERQMTLEQLSR